MNEIVIFKNNNWMITKTVGFNSGWIIGECIGDNWIKYEDGRIVFDSPEKLPKYIKQFIKNWFKKRTT